MRILKLAKTLAALAAFGLVPAGALALPLAPGD